PPVGWRDTLDQQARGVMALTDTKVGQAGAQIKTPAPYPGIGPTDKWRLPPPPAPPGGSRLNDSGPSVPNPIFDVPASSVLPTMGDRHDAGPLLDGGLEPGFDELPSRPWVGVVGGGSYVSTPVGTVLAPGGVIGLPYVPTSQTVAANGGAAPTGNI